jgi:hypothetical protein
LFVVSAAVITVGSIRSIAVPWAGKSTDGCQFVNPPALLIDTVPTVFPDKISCTACAPGLDGDAASVNAGLPRL